jgi:pimeloyl-ACP methyl ester carboxylesterase
VVRAVVDQLLTRAEVDPRRLALAGWSFGGYLALRGASGEPRLSACVLDPGFMDFYQPMKAIFADLPADALENPTAADPALFAPYLEKIEATPVLRWKILQRAFWVHGVSSLPEYLAAAREFTNHQAVKAVRCPVFVAWEEQDALAASAPQVYEALNAPKTLVRFLTREGAGEHCAILARSLFHQRMFDWLDEVFSSRSSPTT